MIKDRRARTYTAALAVKVTSFGLLDRGEQESRQAGWGGVLAGLAREGSPVSRIQWIERTVPADGDEIGRYLGEAWDRDAAPVDSLPMQSYLELDERRARRSRRITSCSSACRSTRGCAWRQIKRAGGKQRRRTPARAASCCANSRRSPSGSPRPTSRSSARSAPGCSRPRFRVAFDPWSRPGLARLAAADPDRDGIDEGAAWPVAIGDVLELVPDRRRVPRDLLDRRLAPHRRRRRVPLAAAPSRPDGASDRRHDRADLAAAGDPRGRGGADNRRRRQRPPRPHGLHRDRAGGGAETEAVARREEELADGHAAVRFAGYVTVSARIARRARAPLLRDRARRADGAARAAPPLRPAGRGFTYTLPLCRGLR